MVLTGSSSSSAAAGLDPQIDDAGAAGARCYGDGADVASRGGSVDAAQRQDAVALRRTCVEPEETISTNQVTSGRQPERNVPHIVRETDTSY